MKKLFLYCSAAILVIFTTCKKPEGDLIGKESIRGRLFLVDTTTQQVVNQPLSGKKVSLRYQSSADTINYLISAYTDTAGYFMFPNLTSGIEYTAFYKENVSNIVYYGSASALAPSNTMIVKATIDNALQTGLVLTVKDVSGNVLKGASICLFTSAGNPGYENNACSGSSINLTTDVNGHASTFNINPGTYYYLVQATQNNVLYQAKGSVTVGGKVSSVPVILQPAPGIHFLTTDENGKAIGNVAICLFSSPILFKLDTCMGSNYSLTSGPDGQAYQFNLAKGKYYIIGQYTVGTTPWIARDSITVAENLVNIKLYLSKK